METNILFRKASMFSPPGGKGIALKSSPRSTPTPPQKKIIMRLVIQRTPSFYHKNYNNCKEMSFSRLFQFFRHRNQVSLLIWGRWGGERGEDFKVMPSPPSGKHVDALRKRMFVSILPTVFWGKR